MIIKGANLGTVEVQYNRLSEWIFFEDERQQIVEKLEKLYFNLFEECNNSTIESFPQEKDRVLIAPGMLNHRCSSSIDSLTEISKYGILASEWFGIPESEYEGVFCAFLDRIHVDDGKNRGDILNTRRLKSRENEVILFFDSNNPIMQKLLHLDYFEYERIKKQTPNLIATTYTKDEIELFETIIEPFSPAGVDMHLKSFLPYADWSAIPGGIPSLLVNGICTKQLNVSEEYVNRLTELFPNATIFDGELQILYSPVKKENKTM